ncbi:hypothetical protein [Embleya sp. NPDC005575]|uniref:hypothetical protein n=1 Tax=Embleya sp. NPDC005575 TaxID=3156892 RepID=UPI0033A23DE0
MTTSSPRPLFTATVAVAVCHLCEDQAPADDEPAVTLRPAHGSPRPVRLCARCRSIRPGRDRGELVADDWTWAFLEREVTALGRDHGAGRWLPYRDELHWAQNLHTATWTQSTVEHALRDAEPHVSTGRLVHVVEPLPRLLALVNDGDPALRTLRRFLNNITAGPA